MLGLRVGRAVPADLDAGDHGRRRTKDAVVLSPHKFVGGPQTPGVLVVRRDLVPAGPTVPGGGTIAFVSPDGELYAPTR